MDEKPNHDGQEPSAEEIVAALKHCSDMDSVCFTGQADNTCTYYDRGLVAHPNDKNYDEYCDILLKRHAADLIERQARDITELTAGRDRMTNAVAELTLKAGELTDRAESAEAREKAIIEGLRDRCEFCIGYDLEENDEPCNTCYNARTFEPDDIPRTKNWTWRGLSQEIAKELPINLAELFGEKPTC